MSSRSQLILCPNYEQTQVRAYRLVEHRAVAPCLGTELYRTPLRLFDEGIIGDAARGVGRLGSAALMGTGRLAGSAVSGAGSLAAGAAKGVGGLAAKGIGAGVAGAAGSIAGLGRGIVGAEAPKDGAGAMHQVGSWMKENPKTALGLAAGGAALAGAPVVAGVAATALAAKGAYGAFKDWRASRAAAKEKAGQAAAAAGGPAYVPPADTIGGRIHQWQTKRKADAAGKRQAAMDARTGAAPLVPGTPEYEAQHKAERGLEDRKKAAQLAKMQQAAAAHPPAPPHPGTPEFNTKVTAALEREKLGIRKSLAGNIRAGGGAPVMNRTIDPKMIDQFKQDVQARARAQKPGAPTPLGLQPKAVTPPPGAPPTTPPTGGESIIARAMAMGPRGRPIKHWPSPETPKTPDQITSLGPRRPPGDDGPSVPKLPTPGKAPKSPTSGASGTMPESTPQPAAAGGGGTPPAGPPGKTDPKYAHSAQLDKDDAEFQARESKLRDSLQPDNKQELKGHSQYTNGPPETSGGPPTGPLAPGPTSGPTPKPATLMPKSATPSSTPSFTPSTPSFTPSPTTPPTPSATTAPTSPPTTPTTAPTPSSTSSSTPPPAPPLAPRPPPRPPPKPSAVPERKPTRNPPSAPPLAPRPLSRPPSKPPVTKVKLPTSGGGSGMHKIGGGGDGVHRFPVNTPVRADLERDRRFLLTANRSFKLLAV